MENNYIAGVNAIIALVVGVGIATLVLIFVGSLGGQTYNLVETDLDNIANDAVSAESFTALLTGTSLANDYIQSGTLILANNTKTINLANFTIDYDAGTVTLVTATYNNTAFTANYTHGDLTIRNSVKQSIVSGFAALEDTGSYLPIVVLAVIISIVLALVLGMTNVAGGNRGGGATL